MPFCCQRSTLEVVPRMEDRLFGFLVGERFLKDFFVCISSLYGKSLDNDSNLYSPEVTHLKDSRISTPVLVYVPEPQADFWILCRNSTPFLRQNAYRRCFKYPQRESIKRFLVVQAEEDPLSPALSGCFEKYLESLRSSLYRSHLAKAN